MKRRTGSLFLVLALTTMLIAATVLLAGCGGNGANNTAGGSAGNSSTDDNAGGGVQVVQALVVNNVEFVAAETDITPMYGPADMPEGNKPFEVFMDFSGSGDAKEALTVIFNEATLWVNGEEEVIGATAYSADGGFVTVLSSTAADLEAPDLSIALTWGNQKLEFK